MIKTLPFQAGFLAADENEKTPRLDEICFGSLDNLRPPEITWLMQKLHCEEQRARPVPSLPKSGGIPPSSQTSGLFVSCLLKDGVQWFNSD